MGPWTWTRNRRNSDVCGGGRWTSLGVVQHYPGVSWVCACLLYKMPCWHLEFCLNCLPSYKVRELRPPPTVHQQDTLQSAYFPILLTVKIQSNNFENPHNQNRKIRQNYGGYEVTSGEHRWQAVGGCGVPREPRQSGQAYRKEPDRTDPRSCSPPYICRSNIPQHQLENMLRCCSCLYVYGYTHGYFHTCSVVHLKCPPSNFIGSKSWLYVTKLRF